MGALNFPQITLFFPPVCEMVQFRGFTPSSLTDTARPVVLNLGEATTGEQVSPMVFGTEAPLESKSTVSYEVASKKEIYGWGFLRSWEA